MTGVDTQSTLIALTSFTRLVLLRERGSIQRYTGQRFLVYCITGTYITWHLTTHTRAEYRNTDIYMAMTVSESGRVGNR